ncbi:DUF1275 domain-containing protein [Flavipsychrobacter stenotrophus]|uniref:DUF1275 domain-containing protein n=1 Tax=Flavipsychrobacter stenotrophus TaxID=2077091 RepID=A0A2S7SVX8_9BACT|nr:YoaK family protein [Flavipsychrobacter stenotrophus]PQJ10767.1 DUF1275 domain-containing protein [Flavipsychrobacter stenotrophus]
MLRHSGRRRNHKQNIRLAAMLCLTAGFVNVSGLLAFKVLTTNVTGHAALFAEQLAEGNLRSARMVGLWMLLFLSGAFCSGYYIRWASARKHNSYMVPVVVEIAILVLVGATAHNYNHSVAQTEFFAGILLFAMGLQNAFVSVISGAAVRTTHLTGLFTDLGIDLSALAHKGDVPRNILQQRIILKVVIILFFLSGAIAGGYIFKQISYHTFYIPAGILVFALFYDVYRIKLSRLYHHLMLKKADTT